MKPGRTAGTSLRLAHGWTGTIAGRYKHVTIVHANTRSGSVHRDSRPIRHLRDSTAAPAVASSTDGTPFYQNAHCTIISASARSPSAGGVSPTCDHPDGGNRTVLDCADSGVLPGTQ